MISLTLPRLGASLAGIRSIEWPIRRLGPYSGVLGFFLLGILCLGVSRAVLIWWQLDRVDVTDA
jgi:hypothetical protein